MDYVRETLDSFFAADEPGVLAIKGDWGAGKTYFIKQYLGAKENLPDRSISFVSLFGLSDIEQVRRRIIPSTISQAALRNQESVSRLQKLLGMARTLPKISDLESFFQSIEDYAIKNLIVVFDDVERKSEALSLQSFLGLVNHLAEHSNSKVIVILNEDQLSDGDCSELAKFREKLIDREILFAPTYETNARLFFKQEDLFSQALDVFQRCDCRNLRVIKRCHLAAIEFGNRFSELRPERRIELLKQVIIVSCLFYQFGGQIDFSKIGGLFLYRVFGAEKEKFPGMEILERVGFSRSDDDDVILNYLKTGLFDDEAVAKILEEDRNADQRQNILGELSAIYRIINGSFQGSAEEFISRMTQFLEEYATRIGWNDLAQAIKSLKDLGYSGDPKLWIDSWIIAHAERMPFEDCMAKRSAAGSEFAKTAIDQRLAVLLTARTPKQIIEKIVYQHGWNPEDTAALDQPSAKDHADWMLADKDTDLLPLLRDIVKTFHPGASEAIWQSIGRKLYHALYLVSQTNDFRRMKVTNILGIPIEELETVVIQQSVISKVSEPGSVS